MATNLADLLRERLKYPGLKKIDPNIQEIPGKDQQSTVALIGQAAIPAVLTALYSLSRNEEGAGQVLQLDDKADPLPVLFRGKENEATHNVARYADVLPNQALGHIENIAEEAVSIIRKTANDAVKLKQFMSDQRHNILVYLPPALHMGELLNDELLDDRTNKMEGPVSNVMHKIEDKLSQGGK